MEKAKRAVFYFFVLLFGLTLSGCNLFAPRDNTSPLILNTANITIEVHSANPNWLQGVSATDNKDGNITNKIQVDSSTVDLTTLGIYDLVYTVKDAAGNETILAVNVFVVDTTAPQIVGAQNIQVEVGTQTVNYLQGVTATDNYDGNLTDSVIVDDSEVNLNVLGIYSLIYTVEDSEGNDTTVSVNVIVVDTTAPQIVGAQNITINVGDTYDYLQGVYATDNYDSVLTVQVDSSQVNTEEEGVYTIIYSVEDSSLNKTTVEVTVTVVLPQHLMYMNLDITLLTELLGEELDQDTLDLIEAISILRLNNYGIIIIPGMMDSPAAVESLFMGELNEDDISNIQAYFDLWQTAFITPAAGLTQLDGQRIMMSFIMGRFLTEDEISAVSIIFTLKNTYNGLKENENNYFDDAELEEIETVLGRSLTEEELEALEVQKLMQLEIMAKVYKLMLSNQIGRYLTLEEQQAIDIFVVIIIQIQDYEVGFPSLEVLEQEFGIILSEEQEDAYLVIKNIYNGMMFNMVLSQVEMQWGRELTEVEKAHLFTYVGIMFEYMAVANEELDPEFNNATIQRIEAVIDRLLTQDEIDSIFYINIQSTIQIIKNALGRELTQDEINAVPVVIVLQAEYVENSGELSPSFEEATNEDIEEVLDRELTTIEEDALVIFRYIMNEMMIV